MREIVKRETIETSEEGGFGNGRELGRPARVYSALPAASFLESKPVESAG